MNGGTPVTYVTGTKRFLQGVAKPPTGHRGSECGQVHTETYDLTRWIWAVSRISGMSTCKGVEWEAPIFVPG
jgi:hypothetical protein